MTTAKIKIIQPKKNWSLDDFREIWAYRELLYFFTWRDIKVRYKQTIVGIAWAIFQPVATMVVFSVVFGKIANIPSEGVPYPIFVYTGLLFWQLFSSALSDSPNTLVGNASILTKVYFPRLLLPISGIITKFVDLLPSTLVLIVLMFYYGYTPHLIGIVLIPVFLFISFATAVGGGPILAAINVKYRDVRYALPFFIQMLLFVTPVIYPSSIAGRYAWILALNPMTGVIKNVRHSILGTGPVDWNILIFSLLISVVAMIVGVIVFKKTEQFFADIV